MTMIEINSIIQFRSCDTYLREIVTGRLGNMVWTRRVLDTGAIGPIQGPSDIDDLIRV